jgi:hypothetical protein
VKPEERVFSQGQGIKMPFKLIVDLQDFKPVGVAKRYMPIRVFRALGPEI